MKMEQAQLTVTKRKAPTRGEKVRDLVVKGAVGLCFTIGIMAACSEGPDGAITWVNFAGLIFLWGAARLSNEAEKKGWVFFNDED